jgi:hypothetical protein
MVYAMDTLGYAKRLRDAGIPDEQAEAHAEAARDFVMAELVTKSDLAATRSDLQSALAATRSDLQSALAETRSDLQSALAETRSELRSAVQRLEARIEAQGIQIEAQTLRLTVRLGGLLAAGIALLAAVIKLT